MNSLQYILNVFAVFILLLLLGMNINVLKAQELSAVHDYVSMNTNETLNIPVLDNDTGTEIVISRYVQPKHGIIILDELTNQFTYTPNVGYYGHDIFVYQITDSAGQTARASVFIDINHNGTAPLTVKAFLECSINNGENTFYFRIQGGVLPYTVTGDYNGIVPIESVINITIGMYSKYNINVTDAAGTVFNINNLNDILPCLWNGIVDIE